tara:strand:- start:221 stop:2020 length:1800 start_codon:yes stop_codon:yes gene_type:complete
MAILKSKQLSTNLSGSYTITGSLETTENISGSYTSTGSFGRVETNKVQIGDVAPFGDIKLMVDGRITADDGSAGSPTITFREGSGTSEDSGFYSPGTNEIGISTDGNASLEIDSSGNVEIIRGNVSGSATSTGSFGYLNVDGDTVIGGNISGSTTSTGSFGYLNVDGDTVIGGNITIGDSDSDSLSISADLTSNLIPDVDSTYDIGSSSKNWRYGYIEQVSATHITASGNISSSGTVTLATAVNFTGASGATQYTFNNLTNTLNGGTGRYLGFTIATGSDVGGAVVNISGSDGNAFIGIGTEYTDPLDNALTVIGTISGSGDLNIDGNITASGNISGSSTSTGSFSEVHVADKVGIGTTQPTYELDVVGDIGTDRYIYHNDDDDTKIEFTSDRVKIHAGSITLLDIRNASQDTVTLGADSDVDAKLQGGDGYVFVQGSDGYVGIKDDSPSYQLDVAGTGRFTGITKVTDTTNSTSTSTGALIIDGGVGIVKDLFVGGKVTAQEFHTEFVSASIQYTSGSTQFGDTEDDTHTFSGSLFLNKDTTEEFIISGSGLLSGSYATSASFGRIDTTGDIYSSGRIYESGTSVIDHATAMAIVFGG